MIGIHIQPGTARETVEAMRRAEASGVRAAWLMLGDTSLDSATLFAAAAVLTEGR